MGILEEKPQDLKGAFGWVYRTKDESHFNDSVKKRGVHNWRAQLQQCPWLEDHGGASTIRMFSCIAKMMNVD
jgi:hypothetical protein